MQFRIETDGHMPDLGALEEALFAIDPAAVVDIDPLQPVIRVSAAIGERELLGVLKGAGHPVTPERIRRVPSECCGGCSS